jgi:hypothetical protein
MNTGAKNPSILFTFLSLFTKNEHWKWNGPRYSPSRPYTLLHIFPGAKIFLFLVHFILYFHHLPFILKSSLYSIFISYPNISFWTCQYLIFTNFSINHISLYSSLRDPQSWRKSLKIGSPGSNMDTDPRNENFSLS